MIRVVDVFAGPGGLGEGFSVFTNSGNRVFDVVLSIEKDQSAFQTLHLRAFLREFHSELPQQYYDFVRGQITLKYLYDVFPVEVAGATRKTWNVRLGPGGVSTELLRKQINAAVTDEEPWVLIGGPPCQAYSVVGRARNRGNPKYNPITDERQRLYIEYLQILADHAPPAFVMENVKGLLSASGLPPV